MSRTMILVGDVRARLAQIASESISCIVTSPPYFGLRDYGCDGQIGLEATPDAYIAELVAVFREARVALALQADGWWLRDEIIWHKPNPMPVSVTDRTTPAHEMLYMFSKSARYHYDMEAVKEPAAHPSVTRRSSKKADGAESAFLGNAPTNLGRCGTAADGMRQPRSVWSIPTRPFKGAHFATFPPDLVRPCIKAGCPAGGTVLDPFFGAGTTGLVAAELGRNCMGIELNPEYARIAAERLGLRVLTPDASIMGRAA